MNWEAPIFQTSTSQNRPKPSISPDFHSLGALGSAISIALEPDLGTPRVRGWIELYEAMAQDFDRAVPYRAAVFLAVCRLDALVTGGIPRGNRGKPNGISPVPKMERKLVFFGYNQHEMGCSLENEGPNLERIKNVVSNEWILGWYTSPNRSGSSHWGTDRNASTSQKCFFVVDIGGWFMS